MRNAIRKKEKKTLTKTKNKFCVLLFSIVLLTAALFIAGTALGRAASAEEACEHDFVAQTVDATCRTEGYTEYTCSLCGESYRDNYTEKAEHSYAEVVIEPTCTHEGYTTHFCTVCGYEYTDGYVDALGHTYQDEITAPTCTEAGYTVHTCSICGDSYSDTYTDPLGHSYETEVSDPTCTAGGFTTYTCTVCGYSYEGDYTEATGHSYAENQVIPTCVSYGYTEHTCENCGDRYVTDYVKAFGHDYVEEIVEATKESIGYTKHICQNCDYSYISDIVMSGDNGYTGEEEEHVHEYEYYMENDAVAQRLFISYQCECGENATASLNIVLTDKDGTTRPLYADENGHVDYSMYNGIYRVTVTDSEGTVFADFELVNGDEEEHTHIYTAEIRTNELDKTFVVEYACECGQTYEGSLTVIAADGAGQEIELIANEFGEYDYSALVGRYQINISNENGEVLYSFEVENAADPGTGTDEENPNPGDGTEDPEPSEPGDGGADNEQPEVPESPSDEDDNNSATLAILLSILGVLAAGGIAVFVVIKKKNGNSKKK